MTRTRFWPYICIKESRYRIPCCKHCIIPCNYQVIIAFEFSNLVVIFRRPPFAIKLTSVLAHSTVPYNENESITTWKLCNIWFQVTPKFQTSKRGFQCHIDSYHQTNKPHSKTANTFFLAQNCKIINKNCNNFWK